MTNKNNEVVKQRASDGYKTPEGEFKEFIFIDESTGKRTKGINLNGETVSFIYKKLVDGEWIEISREEMPKGTIMRAENYPEFCKSVQTNEKLEQKNIEQEQIEKQRQIKNNLYEIRNKAAGIFDISFISENAITASKGTDFTENFYSIFDRITQDAMYIRDLIDDMAI